MVSWNKYWRPRNNLKRENVHEGKKTSARERKSESEKYRSIGINFKQ